MKKLMTMIAAVATAFGLFADEPTTYNGNSFEIQAEGVTDNTWTPDGTIWKSDITDPLDLGVYNDATDPKYGYPTTKVSTNTRRNAEFEGGTTNLKYLKLDTGSATVDRTVADGQLFFDQVIKFTGFEDMQTNFVEGTKIALWTSAIEPEDAEGEEGTEGYVPAVPADTNLYVAVGDGQGGLVNVKVAVAPDFDFNAWHRVTIKNADKVSENYLGFFIWIDGDMATIDGGKKDYFAGDLSNFKSYYDKGQLFISMDGTSATATKVANIGFQGVGSLDDVVVDAQGPAFAVLTVDVTFAPITGAVIDEVKDADGVVEGKDGTYSVKPGDITVTLAPAAGYKMMKSTGVYELKASAAGELTIPVQEGDFVEGAVQVVNAANPTETNIFTEAELGTVLTGLVNGDTATVLKDCSVKNDEANLYEFTKGTTVEVAASGAWTVHVAKKSAVISTITDNVGAFPGKDITLTFDSVSQKLLNIQGVIYGNDSVATKITAEDGTAKLAGNLSIGDAMAPIGNDAGAILKALEVNVNGNKIALVDGGKVITKSSLTEDNFTLPTGKNLEVKDGADGWYTYQIKAAQETWEATVGAPVNATVTVVSNGVGGATANLEYAASYTLPDDGSSLTVTYKEESGYKFADDAKKEFTLMKNGETAATCPEATAIEYTITFATDRGDKPTDMTYKVTDNFPIKLPTIELSGATFKGWTNETYTSAITELAKPEVLGNIALVAEWEQLTGEPAKVLSNDVEGEIPAEKKDQATANATALVNAKGDEAGVAAWVKTVYGEGGKIPAEKIANASPDNVALAIAFDVPVMVEPTISAPVVAEATEGPAAFEFAIKDGATEVEIKKLTDNVKKIVKYAAALGGTNTFGPAQDTEVAIGLDEGKIKAEFVPGPAAGFMKADFTK